MNIDEFFEDYTGGNHNTTSWTPLAIKEFAEDYYRKRSFKDNFKSYKAGFDSATESLIAANKNIQEKDW